MHFTKYFFRLDKHKQLSYARPILEIRYEQDSK